MCWLLNSVQEEFLEDQVALEMLLDAEIRINDYHAMESFADVNLHL